MKKFTYILIVIATMICFSSCSEKKMSVREYLVRLYNDAGGDNWKHNDNWLSDRPVNEWYGIEYDGKNLKIDLDYNNLIGTIDLSGCTQLTELYCVGNRLTSLDVSGCKITQEIPEWFKQLGYFFHDQRYTYNNDGTYTDNGIGWWYPGEPESGRHSW